MSRRVTCRYLLTVAIVALGASFQFYNFQSVNGVQSIVQKWINDTYAKRNGHGLTESGLTLFWSISSANSAIGAFLGSLFIGVVAEKVGRRNGLIANGMVNIFGSLLVGLAKPFNSPEVLVIGRLILGINIGLIAGLVPMYLTEITPVSFRGAAGTAHMIAIAFGDALSLGISLPQILGSEKLWPLDFALPGFNALLLVCFLPFSYESPRYLMLSKNRREEAEKAIESFVGKENVQAIFDDLVKEASIQTQKPNTNNVTIKTLLKRRSLRTPLFISLLVFLAQQFTGCAAIFTYSTDIFTQAGLSTYSARLATMGIGLGYFACVLPTPVVIERFGRRPLELFQLCGCFCAVSVLSISVYLQNVHHLAWASSLSIVAMAVFMCIYGSGAPVAWLITSEFFSQEHRSTAVSISTSVAFFLASVINLAYLPFQRAVGAQMSFLPFIIVLFFSLISLYIMLPETKNRSIEEIVQEFRARTNSISAHIRRSISNISNSALQETENAKLLNNEQNGSFPAEKGYGSVKEN